MRWLIPSGAVCLVVAAVAVAVGVNRGGSSKQTADTTPQALMAGIRAGSGSGYSGTLVAQLSLDLPVSAQSGERQSAIELMSGAHTMRYWYGATDRQRVALVGTRDEYDVFRIGANLWQWDSATNVAVHSSLTAAGSAPLGSPIFPAPMTYAALTPQQLASRTVAAVDAHTDVSVAPGVPIAGRRTYLLTLRPGEQDATRIAEVHIEVDAARKVPLGVQVYAHGQQQPSVDVEFTSITYRRPGAGYFRFTPPPGARVQRGVQPQLVTGQADAASALGIASPDAGWSAITAFRVDGDGPEADVPSSSIMQPVSGSWGSGDLLETPLLCMLVTNDGQVLSGSVDPDALYLAAAAGTAGSN